MACGYIPDANISLFSSSYEVVAFVYNSHRCYGTFVVSGMPAVGWECYRDVPELLREKLVGGRVCGFIQASGIIEINALYRPIFKARIERTIGRVERQSRGY